MSKKNQPHKQVLCKVNTYVDEGIKDLVEMLNSFDKLCTCDSCQGGNGQFAIVYFEYGNEETTSQLEVSEFITKFIELFSGHIDSIDCAGYRTSISIEWSGSKTYPLIVIRLPYESIEEVTNIIYSVRRDLENGNEGKQ